MYLALYRKWRPKTFSDVVGQDPITQTLQREVILQQTAHAYLFTGSRGTGKTSCAKILAKAVNCLHPHDGDPCGECEICRGIDDGSLMDVLEIDAASNNGVEDVRKLREEAVYLPAQCRYRVYIIDETHMLSAPAFHALLKIMEEPPAHVKFILATTEVHKIPATILSRCQRFDFMRISTDRIAERLQKIAVAESVQLDTDAAFFLAKLADGGMRDALSLLDQCISFSETVTLEVVQQATGMVVQQELDELTLAVQQKDTGKALTLLEKIYQSSKDLQRLTAEWIAHLRDMMLLCSTPDAAGLIRRLPEELPALQAQAKRWELTELLHCMTMLQDCADRMQRSDAKRLWLETAVIRLCMPTPDTASLEARITALEQGVRQLPSQGTASSGENAAPKESSLPAREATIPKAPTVLEAPTLEPPAPRPQPEPVTPPKASSGRKPLAQWPEVVRTVTETDPMLGSLLQNTSAQEEDGILYLQNPTPMFGELLRRENSVRLLRSVLLQCTGKQYRIRVRRQVSSQETAPPSTAEQFFQKATKMGFPTTETQE